MDLGVELEGLNELWADELDGHEHAGCRNGPTKRMMPRVAAGGADRDDVRGSPELQRSL